MDHGLELINHILEILDRTIHTQSYPGNIGSDDLLLFALSLMLMSWGVTGVAGGRRGLRGCPGAGAPRQKNYFLNFAATAKGIYCRRLPISIA